VGWSCLSNVKFRPTWQAQMGWTELHGIWLLLRYETLPSYTCWMCPKLRWDCLTRVERMVVISTVAVCNLVMEIDCIFLVLANVVLHVLHCSDVSTYVVRLCPDVGDMTPMCSRFKNHIPSRVKKQPSRAHLCQFYFYPTLSCLHFLSLIILTSV